MGGHGGVGSRRAIGDPAERDHFAGRELDGAALDARCGGRDSCFFSQPVRSAAASASACFRSAASAATAEGRAAQTRAAAACRPRMREVRQAAPVGPTVLRRLRRTGGLTIVKENL